MLIANDRIDADIKPSPLGKVAGVIESVKITRQFVNLPFLQGCLHTLARYAITPQACALFFQQRSQAPFLNQPEHGEGHHANQKMSL